MQQMAEKILSEIKKNLAAADLSSATADLNRAKTEALPGSEQRQDITAAHQVARDDAVALHSMVSDDEAGEREEAAAEKEPAE